MEIDLYDTAKVIKLNNLKEVSDPMLFIKGSIPSPNGLLSTEIFGVSINERRSTFAYIDLHGIFLHPFIYKLLKRINRKFESCVHGTAKFIIKDGDLFEDENGETGINFIYNNWDKFKFDPRSGSRAERVEVLNNYTKNELFTKYWIVIPAFYRDANFENADKGKVSHRSEINDKYIKLIRYAALMTSGGVFDFQLNATVGKIQDTLVELYDFFKDKLAKKEGMIRRNLMGKSTDYASRCVISAARFNANTPEDQLVDFYHVGLPLAHCCSEFNPFIVAWVRNFFRQKFETSGGKIPYKNKKGEIKMIEVKDPELYFNDELIKKEIDNFIKNFPDRFRIIMVPTTDPELPELPMSFTARIYNKNDVMSESNIFNRPMTWCDLLYIAAVDVTKDKCVYITRYPISDYFSIFPNMVSVISTNETMPVYIDGTVYKHYPKIDLDAPPEKVATMFTDTIQMSNVHLDGLNADFDGDQISSRRLFTQEANEEAIKQMHSKARIVSIDGKNMCNSGKEALQTIYAMTNW